MREFSMRVNQDHYFGIMLSSKNSQDKLLKEKVLSPISPCKTPPNMFINSVSPSSVHKIDLFMYATMIWLIPIYG